MPQAGIHGMVGAMVSKRVPKKEGLILGVVLGNMLPDADALAVAYATLTGGNSHGLHRTFTHSIFTILGLIVLFYIIGAAAKRPRIGNLGLGLGLGMLMHSLLDLAIWFRGVYILWPIDYELNFWANYTPPEWWYNKLEMALEFLMIALFFLLLRNAARKAGTDGDFLGKLKVWTWVEGVLFVLFAALVYTWDGYFIPFGALYILSLGLAIGVTIRMKKTLEVMD